MNEEQYRQEMFKQTNQAAIDFSRTIFTTSFLLNGAAATALLASKDIETLRIVPVIFAVCSILLFLASILLFGSRI